MWRSSMPNLIVETYSVHWTCTIEYKKKTRKSTVREVVNIDRTNNETPMELATIALDKYKKDKNIEWAKVVNFGYDKDLPAVILLKVEGA